MRAKFNLRFRIQEPDRIRAFCQACRNLPAKFSKSPKISLFEGSFLRIIFRTLFFGHGAAFEAHQKVSKSLPGLSLGVRGRLWSDLACILAPFWLLFGTFSRTSPFCRMRTAPTREHHFRRLRVSKSIVFLHYFRHRFWSPPNATF